MEIGGWMLGGTSSIGMALDYLSDNEEMGYRMIPSLEQIIPQSLLVSTISLLAVTY
jgi:hypothetical protein